MKRRAPEVRCNKDAYNTFIGVPWNPRGVEMKDRNEAVHCESVD